jgi:DNA-binding transcriptional MerR regulator
MRKVCPECGNVFEATRVSAIYDKGACRQRAHKKGRSGTRPQMRSARPVLRPVADVPQPGAEVPQEPASPDEAALRQRILQMRITGASVQAIARALDLPDAVVAAEIAAALRGLANLQLADSRLRNALDLARLDVLEQQVFTVLQNAQGTSEGTLADPQTVLQASDRLLRIQARRSELADAQAEPARPGASAANRARLQLLAFGEEPG